MKGSLNYAYNQANYDGLHSAICAINFRSSEYSA